MDALFRPDNATLVFRGYIDDPRNTDNAWTETTAIHFHCTEALARQLALAAGSDAQAVQWLDVNLQNKVYRTMYGDHRSLIEVRIALFRRNVPATQTRAPPLLTQRAVAKMDGHIEPSSGWSVVGWLRSLALPEVVFKALRPPAGADPFAFVQTLSRDELELRLMEARLDGLAETIWSAIEHLRQQQASTGEKLSEKFASEGGTFQMAFGSLSLFYSGLEGLGAALSPQ